MKQFDLDRGWLFRPGTKARTYVGKKRGADNRILLDLPHDYSVHTESDPEAYSGSRTGYYPGAYAIYEKYLDIPKDWEGKRILLYFDGVYGYTNVSVEGNTAADHPYGYTPFTADITDDVHYGETTRVQVTANNLAVPNSRFYTGTGIYRHVKLLVAPMTHISPDGIFAYLHHKEGDTAFVTVETEVENHTLKGKVFTVVSSLTDKEGKTIENRKVHYVDAGKSAVCRLMIEVENPHLWDIDDPYLYTVSSALLENEELLDEHETTFGIRTISVDRKNGFMLNGRTLKLKGGCVHHDNGILGAASFKDSEYRKMKLHKDNGFNAIRCAHNPPSKDMLDACDELGLLVMNEAFDMWDMEKSYNDYHLYFDAWWKKDMEAFMKRDRNHPSIIMWSTGNEIPERAGNSKGYRLGYELAEYTRRLDPTRPITNALNSLLKEGLSDKEMEQNSIEFENNPHNLINEKYTSYADSFWGERTAPYAAWLDVVGYNYLNYRYEKDGKAYPDRIICGTESFPMHIDQIWKQVEALPYVIGDFTWTSYDYLGEAGIGKACYVDQSEKDNYSRSWVSYESPYPWRVSNCSDFDICGFERDQLFYRRIVWGDALTHIAVKAPETYGKAEFISFWGWPETDHRWDYKGFENKPIEVFVYSAADEVELFLNGKSLGKKAAGSENRYMALFDTVYAPGELKAVSYKNGKVISEDVLKTAGEPKALRLTADKEELLANGQSLLHLKGEVLDENGLLTSCALPASIEILGAGTLAAFGGSDPKATYPYTLGKAETYKGKLLAILRAGYEAGELTAKVKIGELPEEEIKILVK